MLAAKLIALGFVPDQDFRVQDDGDGPYIAEWRSEKPRPSEAKIAAVEVPPERRRVAKSTIIARLTDAQLEAALGLMTARQKERWRCPGHPAVYADDPETIALLTSIGADPEAVLAEP